ncbi:MAG: anaerobic ribonucleoside-triphosphate reductase, partial [Clostridia bacterium]
MKIIKRNKAEVDFDINKIVAAVTKANNVVEDDEKMTTKQIQRIADSVYKSCEKMGRALSVEEIQDLVEKQIMAHGAYEVAKRYITYRYTRSLVRKSNTTDDTILTLIECNNEEIKQENSNKNPSVNSVQRDYMAGEVSKDITERILLPSDIVEAHKQGIIHFHDADYFAQHMHNCDLVNLEDMLQNGTVITGTMIEKPHSFSTACNIATQIIAQVASSQYGGQSISLTHLAPFVQVSREKITASVRREFAELETAPSEEMISRIVEERLKEEIERGVQTIQYQVVTLMTTNGQAPFVTVFMYLNEAKDPQLKHDLALIIEEVLKQRYCGVKNEAGVFVTPAFPKLIYVLEEDNITEDAPYWYLTRLAAKCTAKRMVPDYISEKVMLKLKVDKNGEGHCYTCMGCRSFLTPYVDENGKPQYYGRFNQGVVTINLVDAACTACREEKNEEKFWKVLDERLELCHRALQCRHERLEGTLSDAAPILWQYGALARLKKGEPITKLLHGG